MVDVQHIAQGAIMSSRYHPFLQVIRACGRATRRCGASCWPLRDDSSACRSYQLEVLILSGATGEEAEDRDRPCRKGCRASDRCGAPWRAGAVGRSCRWPRSRSARRVARGSWWMSHSQAQRKGLEGPPSLVRTSRRWKMRRLLQPPTQFTLQTRLCPSPGLEPGAS